MAVGIKNVPGHNVNETVSEKVITFIYSSCSACPCTLGIVPACPTPVLHDETLKVFQVTHNSDRKSNFGLPANKIISETFRV